MWSSVAEAVAILIGGNLGEVGFTLGATALDGRSPLAARQFLLVNLFTDLIPALAIAVQPPRKQTRENSSNKAPTKPSARP